MFLIGIDPGLTGAVAILDTETRKIVFHDCPVSVAETDQGKVKTFVETRMLDLLWPYRGCSRAIVEHQRSYGYADNAKTVATLCYCYGLWIAFLYALGIPVTTVEPDPWKTRILGSKHAKKTESIAEARLQFSLSKKELKGDEHGRADAALLIHYLELKDKGHA